MRQSTTRTTSKKQSSSGSSLRTSFKYLALFLAVLGVLFILLASYRTVTTALHQHSPEQIASQTKIKKSSPAQTHSTENKPAHVAPQSAAVKNVATPEQTKPKAFEESLGGSIEVEAKKIEAALLEVIHRLNIPRDDWYFTFVERRSLHKELYYFQKMEVKLNVDPALFNAALQKALPRYSAHSSATSAHNILTLRTNNTITHEITLLPSKATETQKPPLPQKISAPTGAKLVIVIDDIGESLQAVEQLLALDFPVTFAIWPHSTHAQTAAKRVHATGNEIIVHHPMQPLSADADPGEGALYVGMTHQEITSIVQRNLSLVPFAVGLNNHMGSRFTQDKAGLQAVLDVLQKRGLFALDSKTHASSIFYEEAQKRGLPSAKRNVFLDVVHDKTNVIFQLNKAEHIAKSQGSAIAIGHPLSVTLQGLSQWAKTRDKSIQIVRLRDLVH